MHLPNVDPVFGLSDFVLRSLTAIRVSCEGSLKTLNTRACSNPLPARATGFGLVVRAGCFELCDGSAGKLMSLFTPSLVAMSINGSFELGK